MSTCHVVRCDECGASANDWRSRTAAAARDAAHQEGWITIERQPGVRKRLDICPSCLAEDQGH